MSILGGKRVLLASCLKLSAILACTGVSDFETRPQVKPVTKQSSAEGSPATSVNESQVEELPKATTVAPESVEQSIEQCHSRALLSKTLRLDFPETKGNCKWDIGEKEGGSMMGYIEQGLSLPVENSWVVCSMAVSSDKEDLYYDDYISLQFNGRVLLGTTGIVDMLEKDSLGLPIYDWSRLQRKVPQGSNTCLNGATKCALPGTQQNGALQLDLDAETNEKLMSHALGLGRYEFQIVATGDNDPAIDCAHTGIPLDVSIKYYVK